MRPLLVIGLLLSVTHLVHADEGAADLSDVTIQDKPNAQVDLGLTFLGHDGVTTPLRASFDGHKPVILVVAYYTCPMLCTLVLNGLTDGMKALAFNAGADFNALTVSVDPRDTPETARLKRDNHLKAYGRTVDGHGWDFLVSQDGNVKTLTDSVGFHYRFENETQQYAHGAGAFVLNGDGKLIRTLHGSTFDAVDLRLALTEAGGGTWKDRMLLWCTDFDDVTHHYVVALGRMVVGSGVMVAAFLGALALLLRRHARAQST